MVQKTKRLALTGLLLILSLPLRGENHTASQEINTVQSSQVEITQEKVSPPLDTCSSEQKPTSAGARMALWLKGKGIGSRLVVLLLSILPISELRGAVPIGIHACGLSWWETALIALTGNLIPVIPILLLLDVFMRLLGHIKFFRKIFDWLKLRAQRKGGLIERYEYLGLYLFVMLPLPFTGAWTGALVAAVLRLPTWRSFLTIVLGVITADIIVTSLAVLGWWGLAAAVVVLPILWLLSRWLEKRGKKSTEKTPSK